MIHGTLDKFNFTTYIESGFEKEWIGIKPSKNVYLSQTFDHLPL